jgi:hypothetical protein
MSDTKTPNPMVLAAKRKVEDKAKRRGRAYGLGQRNPETLPGAHPGSESESDNRVASARWRKLRRMVQAGRFVGGKY